MDVFVAKDATCSRGERVIPHTVRSAPLNCRVIRPRLSNPSRLERDAASKKYRTTIELLFNAERSYDFPSIALPLIIGAAWPERGAAHAGNATRTTDRMVRKRMTTRFGKGLIWVSSIPITGVKQQKQGYFIPSQLAHSSIQSFVIT